MTIKYLVGDATEPGEEIFGKKLLVHICNDQRAWGAGFVLALSKKWKTPELVYRLHPDCSLGQIQMIQVEDDLFVINMIAQTLGHTQNKEGKFVPPIRYWALDQCLQKVAVIAQAMTASVVGPRFGSALAGGDWNLIEEMVNDVFEDIEVPVYIYDLPGAKP